MAMPWTEQKSQKNTEKEVKQFLHAHNLQPQYSFVETGFTAIMVVRKT